MSTASQIKSGGLLSQTIQVEGKTIPGECQVFSVEVESMVNRITTARIVVLDGDAAKESFPVSASKTFVPGNSIIISAGFNSSEQTIFSGIITKQSIQVNEQYGSALEVECKDAAVKMTVGRKNASFTQKTDSDAIESIIGNYSGLSADVTSTTAELPFLQQYYTSDWDFMLSRAEVNGLLVSTHQGKISVFSPTADTSPALTVAYGVNLLSCHADLDCLTQLDEVKASSWDYKTQAVVTEQASNTVAGPGNISSKKLAEVIGLADYQLQSNAPIDDAGLSTWAKAQMLKSELSKIIGELEFQGTALVETGKYLTLEGMGDRFNGDHFVAGVHHNICEGNWITSAHIGISPNWFVQELDVMAPAASGLLPGVSGLHNATVKKIFDDPDSEYRIQVDIPMFNDSSEGVWARLSNFYSTSGAGAFFLPEVGDEVIVGFLNEDPRYPVILGSLYSSQNKPYSELDPDEKNTMKAIVSKSELRVLFDDENQILTLMTPNKNQMVLDDKNKQISIQDENSNSIVMSADGITIKSPKDISIEATQNVKVSGDTGITVSASGGDVETSGTNIKQSADAEYSVNASATASLQAGAELSIQGAMVMIN